MYEATFCESVKKNPGGRIRVLRMVLGRTFGAPLRNYSRSFYFVQFRYMHENGTLQYGTQNVDMVENIRQQAWVEMQTAKERMKKKKSTIKKYALV